MRTDAIRHHIWATRNQLEACAALTDEQLATSVPGTYGSILDTVRHVVGGDCSYLFVISGGRFGTTEVDEETMTVPELLATFDENAIGWETLLSEPEDDDRRAVRHRPDGSSTAAALGIRWAQVVHHSSDHRSQVNTVLTELGHQPEEFDVWAYGLSVGRVSEEPDPE